MAERPPFETRLEDVLARYADSAPTAVDSSAMARAASATGTAGWLGTWLGGPLRVGRAVVLVALLVVLLVAALLGSGAGRPAPDPSVASRVYVSDDHTAWVLGPTREVVASGIPTRHRSGPCGSPLIGGTTLLAGRGFGRWEFSTLADEALPRVHAGLNYAGGERWSPDRIKVAMMNFKGTLTVLDFSDPSAVAEPTWSVPGVMDVVWAPDSQRLLIARRAGTDAVDIELVSIDDPLGTTLGRVAVPTNPDPFATFLWSPDGRTAAFVADDSEMTASPSAPLPVLLPGDVTLIGPIGWGAAAWSPAGDRLALWRDGDLVVADESGIDTVTPKSTDLEEGALAWAGEAALIIEQGRRLLTVALDAPAVTVVDRSSSGRAWAVDGSELLVAHSVTGGVDLAWYRAGSDEVLRTMQLRGSSEAQGPTGEACLDVQQLPA